MPRITPKGGSFLLLLILCLTPTILWGQDPPKPLDDGRESAKKQAKEAKQEPEPVVTRHAVSINGTELDYTATAGRLIIKGDDKKDLARIFFVAYTKDGADAARPVMFAFNGGPGSSAIWLHIGALGPRRVLLGQDGLSAPKRSELVDNVYTWLQFADLVFVDPVGTGFSRGAEGVDSGKFYNFKDDVDSIGRFILLYVTKYGLWSTPKILVGESYGTTRVAGLIRYLQSSNGCPVTGAVLISSVLNFQAILYDAGNDLPYILALPTLAAAALYHNKLADIPDRNLDTLLPQVEQWAIKTYATSLIKGDTLDVQTRAETITQLARFTGLSPKYIADRNLRVGTSGFVSELLRDEHKTLGIFDSRVKHVAVAPHSDYARIDPSLFMVTGPFVSAFNDYVRRDLEYESDEEYEYLSDEVNHAWKWCTTDQGYLYVGDELQEAMTLNPQLTVFFATGLYDLACPYLAQYYMLAHLGLEPQLRDHAIFKRYPSGHQIYTSLPALESLTADVAAFVKAGS